MVRILVRLVRQPEYGTSTPYYVDFIQICLAVKFINNDEIRELYQEKGLTANQIASHFKVSRAVIFCRLRELGINEGTSNQRQTNPQNYRCRVPPYGFAIESGKLVPNRLEMKICRLVVQLVQRQGKGHTEIARELSRLGFKNRSGSTVWDSKTVFNILKRWKDKL